VVQTGVHLIDTAVARWRTAHKRFWNEFVRPELRDPEAWQLDDDTEIVVERFCVVDGSVA